MKMRKTKIENCKQLCQQLIRRNEPLERALKNYSNKTFEKALKEINGVDEKKEIEKELMLT